MNRPIEFRAWHMPTETMYYLSDDDKDGCFNNKVVWLAWDDLKTQDENLRIINHPLSREDCIIMQFTGIYNQLGDKVWEGDILRWDKLADPDEDPDDVDNQVYSSYYYVVYYRGGFCYLHVGDLDYKRSENYYLSDFNSPLEDIVVGNLYEHPHLWELTGEQPLAIQSLQLETNV